MIDDNRNYIDKYKLEVKSESMKAVGHLNAGSIDLADVVIGKDKIYVGVNSTTERFQVKIFSSKNFELLSKITIPL